MPGTTSTVLPSFSHDQHHKTDTESNGSCNHRMSGPIYLVHWSPFPAAVIEMYYEAGCIKLFSVFCLVLLHNSTKRYGWAEQNAFETHWNWSCSTAGLRKYSDSELQTDGSAEAMAREPNLMRRTRGTVSRRTATDRRWLRPATSETGTQQSERHVW